MTLKNLLLLMLFCFAGTNLLAQIDETKKAATVTYSITKLPARWTESDDISKAIDVLLPATIKQLKNAKSCFGCQADFTILVKIDTVFILQRKFIYDSTYQYGIMKEYPSKNTTWFRFRSYFSVLNKQGEEVARLIIANPADKPTYIMKGYENPYYITECTAPVVYLGDDFEGYDENKRYGKLPTDIDLLYLTADRIMIMSKWAEKWD